MNFCLARFWIVVYKFTKSLHVICYTIWWTGRGMVWELLAMAWSGYYYWPWHGLGTTCNSAAYMSHNSWPSPLYIFGSGSWLPWANDTVVHYAAINSLTSKQLNPWCSPEQRCSRDLTTPDWDWYQDSRVQDRDFEIWILETSRELHLWSRDIPPPQLCIVNVECWD